MTPRTRRTVALTSAAAVAALLVTGLVAGPITGLVPGAGTGDAGPADGPSATLATTQVKPTVIAISVDGLNLDALAKLPARQTNWFNLLRRRGTSTTSARTAYEQTITLPNHTGMITGRPIGGATGHHISFNSDRPTSWIARENDGRYLPSIFDVAHDRGMSTALYTSKDKFRFLERSYDATHGAPDQVGADNGRDKVDSFYVAKPGDVAARLKASLTSSHRRNLYFWHISLPDSAGHDYGFMSSRYLAAVARSNALLGQVIGAVRASSTLRSATSVILTADHGGRGSSHSDATKAYNYRVPFYTWGRGTSDGVRLYAKNPDRYYPGTRRIGYAGPQPIRNMDVANTSLRLLGLPALADATPALRTSDN